MWVWLPALVFFVLNLATLSAYRLVYAGRVDLLEQRLEARSKDLAELEERQRRAEQILQRATLNRQRLEHFYAEQLGRPEERLTPMIAGVKELARRTGLLPGSISYPEETVVDHGLVRRSMVFAVEGTYPQLRQLINLLELSQQFLVLQEVTLGETGSNPRLRINLRIGSLFAAGEAPPPRPEAGGRS
jgi:hypothetical protein